MSGKASRDKGNRLERLVVEQLRAAGQTACRVPLSGGAGGDFADDIIWKLPAGELRLECKARATGFKFLYDNLKPAIPLIIKADRQEPLLVLTLSQAIALIGGKEVAASTKPFASPLETVESFNQFIDDRFATTYILVDQSLQQTVREINQADSKR